MSKSKNVSIAELYEEEVDDALALLAQVYPDLSESARWCLALIEWVEWYHFRTKMDREVAEVEQWRREHPGSWLDT